MIGILAMASAGDSLAAIMVRQAGSVLPTSFNGDAELFGLNLFLMTAFTWLGMMMAGAMARARWRGRYGAIVPRTYHGIRPPSGGSPGCSPAAPCSCAAARRP